MAYTAEKPRLVPSSEELRARIPGWGVDLDPSDRPSVPRERPEPALQGVSGVPQQQPERWPRERSVEHALLTPVFGTSCPPHGLSGRMRRLAYERFSEARAAHWLVLMAADRVDVAGSTLRSFASRRPDNPLTETGVRAELSHHGWSSRRGHGRADLAHQALDPLVVAGPWLAAGGAVYAVVRRAATRTARRRRASAAG